MKAGHPGSRKSPSQRWVGISKIAARSRPAQKYSAPFPSRKGRRPLNKNSQLARPGGPGPALRAGPHGPPGLRSAASFCFLLRPFRRWEMFAAYFCLGRAFFILLLGSSTFLGPHRIVGSLDLGLMDVAFSPRSHPSAAFGRGLRPRSRPSAATAAFGRDRGLRPRHIVTYN